MKLPDRRWIFTVLVLLLCSLGIVLHGLPAVPAALLLGPTPAPAPSPAPASVPTPVPGAITVLCDGEPILTLETVSDAQALLKDVLAHAKLAVKQEQSIISVAFDREISLREAVSGEEPLTFAQAQALIRDNPALCPVRCITRSQTIQQLEFAVSAETKDARIPQGARLILQLGRTGERVSITQTTYVNGVIQGLPEKTTQDTLAPLAHSVAAGVYTSRHPEEEPGREEGEKGPKEPDGFSLALPAKGEITSNFGMRKGRMHYGVDIGCDVGDALYAPASGSVVFAGSRSSYGFVLEIDHGGGFTTRIAPVAQCALKIGDTVKAGDTIGVLSAPVDEEDKPHLHMELLIGGIPYNPRQYLH